MLKRNLGQALVLTLLFVVGCTSNGGPTSDPGPTGSDVAMHSDRLTQLADEMSNIASKKAWAGKYFEGVLKGAWVQGSDLLVEVFGLDSRTYEAYRIDLATGVPAWKLNLGAQGSRYPPLAGDRFVVFLLDEGGGMVVATRREGRRMGRIRVPLSLVPAGSAGSSDSTVYLPSLVDSRMHAISPLDGRSGWHFRAQGTLAGAPVVTPRHPRRLVVVGTDAGEVVALPATAWNEVAPGAPSWERRLLGDVSGPLTVAESLTDGKHSVAILVPCEDKAVYCLEAATGEPRWVYRTGSPFRSRPRSAGGKVFARNDRRLVVADLATGTDAWPTASEGQPLKLYERCHGVLAGDTKRIYLDAGNNHVLRVDAATGEVLANASLPSFDRVLATDDVNLLVALTHDGHIVAFH